MGGMEAQRVHVVGASGCGTTTVGRALADLWSVPHADVDDYFWEPTDPPYATQRDPAARLELMAAMFAPRPAWVLSGSIMGWGEALIPLIDVVVFVTLDPTMRLERLHQRERQRYGTRIDPGGDLDAAHAEFLTWAAGYDDPSFAGRSRAFHDAWLATLPCPVLALDGDAPVAELVATITSWEPPPT